MVYSVGGRLLSFVPSDCDEWLYRGIDIYIVLLQREFCNAKP